MCRCFKCCCKCCEHDILFCDRDDPCNIDFLPQTKTEEDNFEGIYEDDLVHNRPDAQSKRHWKWRWKRCCVRCWTFYWRTNPCACLSGSLAGSCYIKHKPTPRLGLLLISAAKIITFLVYFFMYSMSTFWLYLSAYSDRATEGAPPRGEEWLVLDPEASRAAKRSAEMEILRYIFFSNLLSTFLFLVHIFLYAAVFISAARRNIACGCTFVLLWIFPAMVVIYQPIYYQWSYYAVEYRRKTATDPVEYDLYTVDLYVVWSLSLVLVPYEIWLIIWHLRKVKVDRLKRDGYIVEDSTEFLVDATEPNQGQIFLFEDPDAVFVAGQELMLGNRSLPEFEIKPDDEVSYRSRSTVADIVLKKKNRWKKKTDDENN